MSQGSRKIYRNYVRFEKPTISREVSNIYHVHILQVRMLAINRELLAWQDWIVLELWRQYIIDRVSEVIYS